jgi:HEPN domain-containing protein
MCSDADYWIKLSKYDIDTAKSMLESRRYLYVLFTCQQAVEKMAKALVVQKTGIFPPKTHDLVRLVDIAGIAASDEQKACMAKLNYYYLETRYPEQISKISKQINKKTAEHFYSETKKLLKWLKSNVQ